jgi:hypothetical protein
MFKKLLVSTDGSDLSIIAAVRAVSLGYMAAAQADGTRGIGLRRCRQDGRRCMRLMAKTLIQATAGATQQQIAVDLL